MQFDALDGLRLVDLRLLWEAFRDEYPIVEEHPARPPMALAPGDEFQLRFTLAEAAPPPLLWFVSRDGDRLVQVQRDRIVVNWRRRETEPYPRYADTVRPMLMEAWHRLESVVNDLELGPLVPNVCDVLYVNMLEADEAAWTSFAGLAEVVAPWSGKHSDDFLPPPAEVGFSVGYDMTDGPGRLTVEGTPLRRADSGAAALLLQLTARGPAASGDLAGAVAFLDRGREWIVKGFVSVTTDRMHEYWGMADV